MSVLALVLGGGMGQGLSVLTQARAKPAVPFAGKYRIIDYPLSNLVNSYIYRIAILAQFKPFSMIEHIGTGEPWGLHRQDRNGVQIWQPYLGRTDQEKYLGTADAVYQNRKYIAEDGSDTVLILSGDQVFRMDYRKVLQFHQEKGADLTIVSTQVPLEDAHNYGLGEVAADQRITSFEEKPDHPRSTLASLGMYVFNTPYLLNLLEESAQWPTPHTDFGRDILPHVVQQGKAYAYPYQGFWLDIGDISTYWKSQMALLEEQPAFDLMEPDWTIHTRSAETPPTLVRSSAKVKDSLICDGCVISGEVDHSILSPGVRVEAGAVVRDSIILNDTVIRSGAIVDHCVIDKEGLIGVNARVGTGEDAPVNREEPKILFSGITVVGKQACIPDGSFIGRNCRIDAEVTPDDFNAFTITGGETVHHSIPG